MRFRSRQDIASPAPPPEDRGPTPYFHGREAELEAFSDAMKKARAYCAGTIMVFQGPPGAGKTALLHECRKHAHAAGWRAAEIYTDGLYDPKAFTGYLKGRYIPRWEVELGGGLPAPVALTGKMKESRGIGRDEHKLLHKLHKAAKRKGLVLLLDEAQKLRSEVPVGSAWDASVRRYLERILNGKIGAPVILVCGGLGTTTAGLRSFGLSRLASNRTHLLGALDAAAARAVIRDWLVHHGGADPAHPHTTHWAHALAAEGQNWPQHLHNYAEAAVSWARRRAGQLESQVPAVVLAQGRQRREQYYAARLADIKRAVRIALANAVRQQGAGRPLSETALITVCGGEAAFNTLLYKGVIAETPSGLYHVPIPSMHDWLVTQYATEKEPARPPLTHGPGPQLKRDPPDDLGR